MRILDRYLLREFAGYLALALTGTILLYLVMNFVDNTSLFLNHHASVGLILGYYAAFTPLVFVQMLPVALMMATFLALGQLNKFGELTAMRASGVSLARILAPVFVTAVFCTVASLLVSELVVPPANRLKVRILDEQIQHMESRARNERPDITYLGQGGRIWYTRLYVVSERRMHEVALQEFHAGQLRRRIDAAEAAWDGRRWVFSAGYVRTFHGREERAERFERMAVGGLGERPEDFAKESAQPGEMNFMELREYVQRLRTSGARVANYLVDLHLKLSFPFVCIIVVLIGGALATRLRMQSAALGFGLTLIVAYLYYALMRSGQAMGHSGVLPPYLAAWIGDIVFGGAGLAMMAGAQKS